MAKLHIRKGDTVMVLAGNSKGQTGKVLQVLVKEDAVLFYTAFPRGGCAGFLYEKVLGETAYYDYVELVENWKIFYRIPLE